MSPVGLTPRRLLALWWLLAWRGYVAGLVLQRLLELAVGPRVAAAGWEPALQDYAEAGMRLAVGAACSFVVVESAFHKRFHDFRLVLLARDGPGATELPLRRRHHVAVWWLLFWRDWAGWIAIVVCSIGVASFFDAGDASERSPWSATLRALAAGWSLFVVFSAVHARDRGFRLGLAGLAHHAGRAVEPCHRLQ